MHLGVLVSADGSHDAHFQRGIKQGNARVAAKKPLFTDDLPHSACKAPAFVPCVHA